MRSLLLVLYHLCLRCLALLGLPFLVILGYHTLTEGLSGTPVPPAQLWPNLVLLFGAAPLCLFFALPNALPRRVKQPDVRDLGPFLFVGLGFAGFAVMHLAQAALQGLALPDPLAQDLPRAFGAAAILLGGAAGLLALTLCNHEGGGQKITDHPAGRTRSRAVAGRARPDAATLRALRHSRMKI